MLIATLGRLVSCSHESGRPMARHALLTCAVSYYGSESGARVLANARLNQILQTGKST